MSSTTVIRPCIPEFHPQTTLKQVATQTTADRLYFLSGVHLYALNAGDGALQWGLLISHSESRYSREGAPAKPAGSLSTSPPTGRRHSFIRDGLLGVAVQNDRLFVTSMNGFTHALSADSGESLWEHPTGVHNGLPTVVGDTVYVSSGTTYALSIHDGSERWSSPTPQAVTSRSVIVNDTLYTGSIGNAVYALDRTSGRARWIYPTNGQVHVTPIVDQGVVYAGSSNDWPRIFALDAESGQLLWQRDETSDTMADIAIADGMLYASDCPTLHARGIRMVEDCRLIGLDPHTGKVVWHYSGIGLVRLLVHGHVLYVAAYSGDLYAFDTQTQHVLWQQKVRSFQSGEVSRMKLLGDELYVGFNDLGRHQFASVHALDAQKGREDWSAAVKWNVSTFDLA